MSDEPDWSPWFDHDGRGVPREVIGRLCRVRHENALTGEISETELVQKEEGGRCSGWIWANFGNLCICSRGYVARVLAYRIKRPPAVTQILGLLEDLPAWDPGLEEVP